MEKIFLFIYEFIFEGAGIGGAFNKAFGIGIWHWWDVYRFWAFGFSAVFFVIVVVCIHKLRQLRMIEYAELEQAVEVIAAEELQQGNNDWKRVKQLMASNNISDWKVAVLEADKMLDQLVTGLGYQGEDLGAKLMSIGREDFRTLEEAWQAHKFRNRIAHTPKLDLNRAPFEQAIDNFEKVFREFSFI